MTGQRDIDDIYGDAPIGGKSLYGRKRLYPDARLIINVIKIINYIFIVTGGILFLLGLATIIESENPAVRLMSSPLLVLPGLGLVWLGFIGLAQAQMTQASVDSAEAAVASLRILINDRINN